MFSFGNKAYREAKSQKHIGRELGGLFRSAMKLCNNARKQRRSACSKGISQKVVEADVQENPDPPRKWPSLSSRWKLVFKAYDIVTSLNSRTPATLTKTLDSIAESFDVDMFADFGRTI